MQPLGVCIGSWDSIEIYSTVVSEIPYDFLSICVIEEPR